MLIYLGAFAVSVGIAAYGEHLRTKKNNVPAHQGAGALGCGAPHERRCPRDVRGDRGITALPARIQCWQRGTAYGKSCRKAAAAP